MTGNADSRTTSKPISASRAPWPFRGVVALISGAAIPVWVFVAVAIGGPEAAAWAPVTVLFLVPVNLIFFALIISAALCGVLALRNPGPDRPLGWIGLILAGLQLVASIAYLVWSLADILLGG